MTFKHLLAFLALALLLTSCQKDVDEPARPGPDTTISRIVLSGKAGTEATLTLTATEAWSIEGMNEYFTVSPSSGSIGKQVVTITPTKANTTRKRLDLGTIVLRYASGGQTPIPVMQAATEVSQTLMIYLAGRGNLVSAFERNVANAMKAIDNNILGDSRLLLFWQTSSTRAEISELSYDATLGKAALDVLLSFDTSLVSTDGATMTYIMKEMMSLSPAKQYGLIMGSHATGWVPSDILYIGAPGKNAPVDSYWQKTPGGPETRWFGQDNNKTMDVTTIAQSLGDTGVTFEYLIFDACFMSSIEAIYDLKNVVRYVIGSPCEVMLYGFPYDEALAPLFTDNGTSYDLQRLCESFHRFYSTTTLTQQSGCIALADCSQLDALAQVMRRIHAKGLKSYDPMSIQVYEGLTPSLFYDLGHYVELACSDAALLAEFKEQMDRTFPAACRLHTPIFYTAYGAAQIPVTNYSGVSVSEPSEKYVDQNKQTAWYRVTHE